MNNDLIVMTFDNEQDALKARGALEIMHISPFLGALNTLPVSRDAAGKVVYQAPQLPNDQVGPDSWIPNQFVNTIFGESEEEMQKLVAAGLDESFLKLIKTALNPGCSMILLYIRHDSLVDTQQVLEALKQYNGTLYQTTISPQVEDTISQLERLGGLKNQGVLTEEEFQAQKAKILST